MASTATVENIEQLGGESYLYCRGPDGVDVTVHMSGQTGLARGAEIVLGGAARPMPCVPRRGGRATAPAPWRGRGLSAMDDAPSGALPRYQQISELLIRDIAAGRLMDGARLCARARDGRRSGCCRGHVAQGVAGFG